MPFLQQTWRAACALTGFALLVACSATGHSIASLSEEINATLSDVRTSVEVGDAVNVAFPYRTDWNHTSRVMEDGYASFYLVGEVKVRGLSISSLNERLSERYDRIREGESVALTASIGSADGAATDTSNSVFVVGEVNTPGAVAVSGRALTLIEAISAAGGHLKATANLSNTILIRRIRGTNEMRSWRLDANIYEWGQHPAIFLQSRDVIFVPNTAIDDVDMFVDQWIRQMIPLPTLPLAPSTL